MPLPNLLIIGAMKAGTTSLYVDIASHSSAFLPENKEPMCLCYDEVLAPAGRAKYEAIYAEAEGRLLRCDASTAYSKRPVFEGVPDRALAVLPAGFKVIYMVRHPIERIVSQHHHEHFDGEVGASIDDAVRQHDRFIHYSRYAYQLEPWLEAVGRDRIRVVRFEDYVKSRRAVVEDLAGFVGLPADEFVVDEKTIYNKSQGKPVKNRLFIAVQHNWFYRRFLRPIAPPKLRLTLWKILLPRAPGQLPPPRRDTVELLKEALWRDVARLSELLELSEPMWPGFVPDTAANVGPSIVG